MRERVTSQHGKRSVSDSPERLTGVTQNLYHRSAMIKKLIPTLLVMTTCLAAAAELPKALSFSGTDYFHRWTNKTQHEFTPAKQEDLSKWTDMVTINQYPQIKDGEGLAGAANSILGAYQTNRAMIVKTNSVPRTKDAEAEHMVVALFPQPKFIEAVFTRIKMTDGIGTSIVYSHREYGEKIGPQMSAWLQKNGPTIEKDLMSWTVPAK